MGITFVADVTQRDNAGMAHRQPHSTRAAARPAAQALTEQELARLQALLDALPAPLEPLDVSMFDGFLCGVLLQPQPVAESRWLPHLTDVDATPLPAHVVTTELHALARRRHGELEAAITQRRWFDPWVFELDAEGDPSPSEAVYPWVAGFATAMEFFPALLRFDAAQLNEPLSLLYRHLDADDLEDADDLLELIEALEPPADLATAVEELVRATLLLADVSRPLASAAPVRRPARR